MPGPDSLPAPGGGDEALRRQAERAARQYGARFEGTAFDPDEEAAYMQAYLLQVERLSGPDRERAVNEHLAHRKARDFALDPRFEGTDLDPVELAEAYEEGQRLIREAQTPEEQAAATDDLLAWVREVRRLAPSADDIHHREAVEAGVAELEAGVRADLDEMDRRIAALEASDDPVDQATADFYRQTREMIRRLLERGGE